MSSTKGAISASVRNAFRIADNDGKAVDEGRESCRVAPAAARLQPVIDRCAETMRGDRLHGNAVAPAVQLLHHGKQIAGGFLQIGRDERLSFASLASAPKARSASPLSTGPHSIARLCWCIMRQQHARRFDASGSTGSALTTTLNIFDGQSAFAQQHNRSIAHFDNSRLDAHAARAVIENNIDLVAKIIATCFASVGLILPEELATGRGQGRRDPQPVWP